MHSTVSYRPVPYRNVPYLHRRPYRDVITESDTKRLKNQLKEGHLKTLKGRPRKPTELGYLAGSFTESDITDVEILDDDDIITLRKDNTTYQGVQVQKGKVTSGAVAVLSVSKNMLLEASLLSLESLGRQRMCGVPFSPGVHGRGIYVCVCDFNYLNQMHKCVFQEIYTCVFHPRFISKFAFCFCFYKTLDPVVYSS